MVSSGEVNGDSSSLQSYLNDYKSKMSELSSIWKGSSYENITSKADSFYSEFSSTIEKKMSAFASACDLYEQYKSKKDSLETARSNYNRAVSNGNQSDASTFNQQISSINSELSSLKSQIESYLQTASSSKLEATSSSTTTTTTDTTQTTTTTDTTTTTSTSQYVISPHQRLTSNEERNRRLAVVGGNCGSQSEQDSKMTTIEVPYWNGSSVSTMNLTVNKNLTSNYTNVFKKLADMKYTILPNCTGAYDYNHTPRPSGAASDHTLGSAIDINWDHNWNTGDGSSYSVRGKEDVIAAFASEGFYWGGDWQSTKDDMHFSFTGY